MRIILTHLLAMPDYISRINDIPICLNYEDLRSARLKSIIYPESVPAIYAVSKSEAVSTRESNSVCLKLKNLHTFNLSSS